MWKTFFATLLAPCYVTRMETNQEQEVSAGDDKERQDATEATDMARLGATEALESKEHRLLTVKEAVGLFNQNGILRSKKSIQRFCKAGALDCTRDPDENRWYIEPGSVERLIGEIHDIQSRHNQEATPFSQGATGSDNDVPDATDLSRQVAPDLKPKEGSRKSGPVESWNLTDKAIVEGLLAQLDAKDTQIKAKDNQIEQLHVLLKQAQEKIPQLQPGHGSRPHEEQEQTKDADEL